MKDFEESGGVGAAVGAALHPGGRGVASGRRGAAEGHRRLEPTLFGLRGSHGGGGGAPLRAALNTSLGTLLNEALRWEYRREKRRECLGGIS